MELLQICPDHYQSPVFTSWAILHARCVTNDAAYPAWAVTESTSNVESLIEFTLSEGIIFMSIANQAPQIDPQRVTDES